MEHDLDEMHRRAIAWHIRLRDGNGEDWDAFSDWLAQDPRHAQAYERVEASDHAIDSLLAGIDFREPANDDDAGREAGRWAVPEPERKPWHRRWAMGGIAAAALIAIAMTLVPRSDPYELHTAAGEQRMVTLDGATRIVLNGGTTMRFDRNDPRFAQLIEGEALFNVRHDEARPFTLHVGQARVQDAGTVFNVVKAGQQIRVGVSEGIVVYNPDAQKITLGKGEALVDTGGGLPIRRERVDADSIGGWKHGRFQYDGAPLAQVAADLERSLGARIAVDPAIASRPITGAIALDGKGATQRERLASALGVVIVVEGDRWIMTSGRGGAR